MPTVLSTDKAVFDIFNLLPPSTSIVKVVSFISAILPCQQRRSTADTGDGHWLVCGQRDRCAP